MIVGVRDGADVSVVGPRGDFGWREILPPPAGHAPVRLLERG